VSSIKIINNFLNKQTADDVENLLLSGDFNWFFSPNTYGENFNPISKNEIETYQLTHTFYKDNINSPYFNFIVNLIKDVDYKSVLRIRANFVGNISNLNKEKHQPIHTDRNEKNCKTLLYYVNDSDGDTIFFDDKNKIYKKVKPKKNRAVLFNSNIKHAGSNPIKSKYRVVINYIMEMYND